MFKESKPAVRLRWQRGFVYEWHDLPADIRNNEADAAAAFLSNTKSWHAFTKWKEPVNVFVWCFPGVFSHEEEYRYIKDCLFIAMWKQRSESRTCHMWKNTERMSDSKIRAWNSANPILCSLSSRIGHTDAKAEWWNRQIHTPRNYNNQRTKAGYSRKKLLRKRKNLKRDIRFLERTKRHK